MWTNEYREIERVVPVPITEAVFPYGSWYNRNVNRNTKINYLIQWSDRSWTWWYNRGQYGRPPICSHTQAFAVHIALGEKRVSIPVRELVYIKRSGNRFRFVPRTWKRRPLNILPGTFLDTRLIMKQLGYLIATMYIAKVGGALRTALIPNSEPMLRKVGTNAYIKEQYSHLSSKSHIVFYSYANWKFSDFARIYKDYYLHFSLAGGTIWHTFGLVRQGNNWITIDYFRTASFRNILWQTGPGGSEKALSIPQANLDTWLHRLMTTANSRFGTDAIGTAAYKIRYT